MRDVDKNLEDGDSSVDETPYEVQVRSNNDKKSRANELQKSSGKK